MKGARNDDRRTIAKESVVQIRADERGNGYLGVFDRKGKGRVIQPGP